MKYSRKKRNSSVFCFCCDIETGLFYCSLLASSNVLQILQINRKVYLVWPTPIYSKWSVQINTCQFQSVQFIYDCAWSFNGKFIGTNKKKLLGCNFMDSFLCLMKNDYVSLFVKDINSIVQVTHKINDNYFYCSC